VDALKQLWVTKHHLQAGFNHTQVELRLMSRQEPLLPRQERCVLTEEAVAVKKKEIPINSTPKWCNLLESAKECYC